MLKEVSFSFSEVNTVGDTSETSSSDKVAQKNTYGFDISMSAVFMLAQTLASCLAGVYNEYLLKDKGCDVNIFVQNVFMYLDSIVCNVALLILRGDLFDVFTCNNVKEIFKFNVIIIIINNAAVGIVTSFFLKYMNSILKTFASALELVFTALLSYFLFGIPIYVNTALAISVVSLAIYLYSQTPVVNKGKFQSTKKLPSPSMSRKLLDSDTETDLEMETV